MRGPFTRLPGRSCLFGEESRSLLPFWKVLERSCLPELQRGLLPLPCSQERRLFQQECRLLSVPSSDLRDRLPLVAPGKGFVRTLLSSLPRPSPSPGLPTTISSEGPRSCEVSVHPARHEALLLHHHDSQGSPTLTCGQVSSTNSEYSPEKAGSPRAAF